MIANSNPEQEARVKIDHQLAQSGREIQDFAEMKLKQAQGLLAFECGYGTPRGG